MTYLITHTLLVFSPPYNSNYFNIQPAFYATVLTIVSELQEFQINYFAISSIPLSFSLLMFKHFQICVLPFK
jgi:hypothetical protein